MTFGNEPQNRNAQFARVADGLSGFSSWANAQL